MFIHYEIHICLEIKHSKFCLHAQITQDLMAKEFSFLLKWWISRCDTPIRPGKSINVRILKMASSKVKREKKKKKKRRVKPNFYSGWVLIHAEMGAAMPRFKKRQRWRGPLGGGAWPVLNHNDGHPARPLKGSERDSPLLLIFQWFLLSNTTRSSSGLPENNGSWAAAAFVVISK